MSWLLQQHNGVSDFGPGGLGSIPSQGICNNHSFILLQLCHGFYCGTFFLLQVLYTLDHDLNDDEYCNVV